MTIDAYEIFDSGGGAPILIFCDHASNRVPDAVNGGTLGLPAKDMVRHIAFDIGARGVALSLTQSLGGQAILSRFSRLVIDPNRGEDDPTLIMQLYDGSIIPANRKISPQERQFRLQSYHRPYHAAAADCLDFMHANATATPIIISVHSFTPKLTARPPRPWHIGILYADDTRLAAPLLSEWSQNPNLVVGDNLPYHGKLEGDCMATHGIRRRLPHVLIELRNDLIADASGETEWANRLLPALRKVIDDFWKKEASANG